MSPLQGGRDAGLPRISPSLTLPCLPKRRLEITLLLYQSPSSECAACAHSSETPRGPARARLCLWLWSYLQSFLQSDPAHTGLPAREPVWELRGSMEMAGGPKPHYLPTHIVLIRPRNPRDGSPQMASQSHRRDPGPLHSSHMLCPLCPAGVTRLGAP